jgi:hypothetical protein
MARSIIQFYRLKVCALVGMPCMCLRASNIPNYQETELLTISQHANYGMPPLSIRLANPTYQHLTILCIAALNLSLLSQ